MKVDSIQPVVRVYGLANKKIRDITVEKRQRVHGLWAPKTKWPLSQTSSIFKYLQRLLSLVRLFGISKGTPKELCDVAGGKRKVLQMAKSVRHYSLLGARDD